MEDETPSSLQSRFEDSSTDCAICLEPLVGGSGDHHDRVITLTCGHKWHYACIVEQLQTAQPTSKQRLLFTGCQCAKCGSICDHPDLRDLTRTTDVLRDKVDRLLQEQLALDAPDLWKKAQENPASRRATLDHARRKYAFYLCSHCREPYFGGTVECADQVAGADEREGEERLCVACAPQSQVTCRNPLEHRGHLVWKCRYCCRPSTHLCYGNVHFCDDCHDRNSQRVRQLRSTSSRTANNVKPPPLTPIPCRGADCPYPKPENATVHSNGPTLQSELVYGCAWCQSTAQRGSDADGSREPGSCNLLRNPSGQLGMQGWRQLNPNMAWVVETSELPVNITTTTNFVSSFQPCVMEQTIDLATILTSIREGLTLEISARYMARTDCPSVFRLTAGLMDEQRRILSRSETPVLDAPPDYWEQARLTMPVLDSTTRYLTVAVLGKDSRFWQGRFGSKVADISVRLLGSPAQLEEVLQPAYLQASIQANNSSANQQRQHQVGREGAGAGPGLQAPQQLPALALIRDGLLPIICFLILAWLLQS